MTIDWGSVPDWVASVATIGVVAFAAIAVASERRDRKLAEKRAEDVEEREQEEAEKAQAKRISVWTTLAGDNETDIRSYLNGPRQEDDHSLGEGPDPWRVVIHILNGSDSSITGVAVKNSVSMEVSDSRWVGALGPGHYRYWDLASGPGSPTSSERMRARIDNSEIVEWLEFADINGKVWRRHVNGVLERVDKEPDKSWQHSR